MDDTIDAFLRATVVVVRDDDRAFRGCCDLSSSSKTMTTSDNRDLKRKVAELLNKLPESDPKFHEARRALKKTRAML